MTTFSAVPNSEIAVGAPITNSLMTKLRDNLTAIIEGDATASSYRIQTNALADLAVSAAKLADEVVTRAKLASDAAAGTNIVAASDAEATITGTTAYAKVKEIYAPYGGTFTVSYDHKSSTSSYNCNARIYINGVAVGTNYDTNSTSYVSRSENISVAAGDLVQLYINIGNASETGYARNFRAKESAPKTFAVNL